ncbi:MAG: C25 family cysteine peptidase, partial [Bacteroidota bacterium]|nr:C25 family cysteine peptidase [Bacteroidota bacterium]
EEHNYFEVTENSASDFSFINHFSKINTQRLKTKEGGFVKLIVNGYVTDKKFGKPELPVFKKLLRVPFGGQAVVKIINKQEQIISLSDYGIYLPIFPNQPSISKGDNADDVPFIFDRGYYKINQLSENIPIKIELLGKMREMQMARLNISPFSYNPITNKLKIITKIEVKIVFKNTKYLKDIRIRKKYFNPNFEHQFKQFVNYLPLPTKDVISTYPVKYVIIADPMFQTILQPFVEWKTKKGFEVVEGYTNDPNVGNTTTSIKAFIKNMYDNTTINNPAPSYVLLVGDDAQVPSFNGSTGTHLSDMYYCEMDGGGDFYPEMYYGRFSATILEELTPQILKTLEYEKYTMPDPSYLDEVVMVAGVDASMAPTYGNGQINYGNDNYFNAAHGLTSYTYLYGSGSPITSDMSVASAAIIADISGGVAFANYKAQCGSSGWSDPSFSTSDVPSLQNTNEYG